MDFYNLKSCPFCGSNVKFLKENRKFECSNCGAVITFNGYSHKSETELINRYNDRAIVSVYTDKDFIVIP